jgi:hypothetical protein
MDVWDTEAEGDWRKLSEEEARDYLRVSNMITKTEEE